MNGKPYAFFAPAALVALAGCAAADDTSAGVNTAPSDRASVPVAAPVAEPQVPPLEPTVPSVMVPVPEPMAPAPEPMVPAPEPMVPEPESMAPAPEVMVPEPEPMVPAPEPMVPAPEPMVPAPEPMVPEPEPMVPEPEPPQVPVGPTEAELLAGSWAVQDTRGTPSQRHECGFGEVNGKFYLVGGRGDKDTDIYDPATNTWSVGARPPIELHHFQPVGFEGKLYVIAALTGRFPREDPVTDFHIYDPVEDEWGTGASVPQARARGSAGVAVYEDKFYVVSGIQDGHHSGWVPWFDVYDPEADTWEQLPDAPRSRDHVAVGVANDKLYVAGGRRSSRVTGEVFALTVAPVDMYDFKTGEWTTLPNNLPTERAGNSTVVVGNFLVVIGGERAGNNGRAEAVDAVEALNLTTHEWLELPGLARTRHATSAVYFGDKIYTAAGSAGGGGGPEVNTLEIWETP